MTDILNRKANCLFDNPHPDYCEVHHAYTGKNLDSLARRRPQEQVGDVEGCSVPYGEGSEARV